MGRPYRIGAHLPEDTQLPFDCTHIDRRPQCPEIVMHADALQHQPLAVEKKAFMGKLRPANAERRGITLHNPVAATYRRDGDIPIRMSGPPEPGIIHGKLLYEQLPVLHAVDDIFSPGQYLSRACTVGAERKQLGRHDRSRHLHPVVTQLDAQIDRSTVGGDMRRGYKGAPMCNADRIGLCKPHVAVDSAAGIPTARFGRIVEPDGQCIVARHEAGGQVDSVGGIAVGPSTGQTAVAPHRRKRHGSVDLEENAFSEVSVADTDRTTIPCPAPPRQFSGLTGILLPERALDTPVMGKIERAPCRVIELRSSEIAPVGSAIRNSRLLPGRQQEGFEPLVTQPQRITRSSVSPIESPALVELHASRRLCHCRTYGKQTQQR